MRSQKLAHKFSSFSRLQGLRKPFRVLKKGAICLQVALFSVSLLAAETGVSGATPPVENASKRVSKQSDSFDTAKAQSVDAVAQAKPVRPSAANNERLAILESERRRIVERLEASKTDAEETRHQADLSAIDREISLALKASPATAGASKSTSVARKSTASPITANEPAVNTSSASVSYESWDIFKNFGTKGN